MAWGSVLRTLGLGAFARGARPDMGYAAPTYAAPEPPPERWAPDPGAPPSTPEDYQYRMPDGSTVPYIPFNNPWTPQGPLQGQPTPQGPPQTPSNRNDPPPSVPFGFTDDAARARWQANYDAWQRRNGGISQQQWHAQNPYDPVEHEAQLDQMRPGWRTEFPQSPGASVTPSPQWAPGGDLEAWRQAARQPAPVQSFYGGLNPLALAMLGRFGMRRR